MANNLSEPEADRLLDVGSAPSDDVKLEACDGCNNLFDEKALILNCGEEWLCAECYGACDEEGI